MVCKLECRHEYNRSRQPPGPSDKMVSDGQREKEVGVLCTGQDRSWRHFWDY